MAPCPLCWLRVHGYPEIPEEHGKEWWLWLAARMDDDLKIRDLIENAWREEPAGVDLP